MRGTIAAQLQALGVADERSAALADADLTLARAAARPKPPPPAKSSHQSDGFEAIQTINQFRQMIRHRLLNGSAVTPEMVDAAHRFQIQPGGRRLVWFMYRLQEALLEIGDDADRRTRYLAQAFRKVGPDPVTIPK